MSDHKLLERALRHLQRRRGSSSLGTREAFYDGHDLIAAIEARLAEPDPEGWMNELAAEIVAVNVANGWKVPTAADWPESEQPNHYKIGTLLALVHSEVSEALEAVRKNDRENFEEELADVIIRVLDLAGGLGVDIDQVVQGKIDANRQRGFRHGGKAV